jgi:allophanate hydrolase
MPPVTIAAIHAAYADGLTPSDLVREVAARASADDRNAWIARRPLDVLLAEAKALEGADRAKLPLYGVPFAIKDNIDLAGVPTTAGCPAFAFTPDRSATVVSRLMAAGAIPIGKTNLDQFATGLNGTRSPYGPGRNSFDPDFISGGSSSGSAIAVATGQVPFALGTDTAGSGRVPAAFNNLVGLKPTCGLLSTTGVVPACRSIDTVSIFALTAEDAAAVFAAAEGHDPSDPYARAPGGHGFDIGSGLPFRFGVPAFEELTFFDDTDAATLFAQAATHLQALGGTPVTVPLAPFLEAAALLYGQAFVAERTHAAAGMLRGDPAAMHPVVREIMAGGERFTAVDAWDAIYRLKALKARCDSIMAEVDVLLLPTAPTIFAIEEMEADPIRLNARLGTYTNFVNLLDYAAIAVPAGFRTDGLPVGVTFVAAPHQDVPLLRLAARWQTALGLPLGATGTPCPAMQTVASAVPSGRMRVAVCGAHMQGLPLNWQLTQRDGRLVARTLSAPRYRLYALPGGPPARPGMVKVAEGGHAIEVEVWDVRAADFGTFVQGIPAPLGIGKVTLADGSEVPGFICETAGTAGAEDVTAFGGWRAYLSSKA